MFEQIPDFLHDAIGIVIAEQRRHFESEADRRLELLVARSSTIIADLEAKVARLETANELRWIDERKRIDAELLRVREAQALVKDGERGLQGDPGPAGKDANPEEIAQIVLARMPAPEKGDPGEPGRDGAEGPRGPQGEPGEPGKSVTAEEVAALVLKQMPTPEKGDQGDPGEKGEQGPPGEKGDPGPQGERGLSGRGLEYVELIDGFLALKWSDDENMQGLGMIRGPAGEPGLPGEKGERGEPGQSVTADEVAEVVLRQMPLPEKGEQGPPGEPGPEADYDLIARMIDDSIKALPTPKDGVGMAGMLIDRSGSLIATMTDGTVRELGLVVGRDGAPGAPGKDGQDGISFDDFQMSLEHDGERTITFKVISNGKELAWPIKFPFMIYREIWKQDTKYEAGDTVTFGGSIWVAKANTSEKPGNGSADWQLAAKHGRDGRDGLPGKDGAPGRPGRDLTLGGK